MPIFILFIGVLLIVAGINNKIPELIALVKEDFRPTENVPGFHVWIIAIVVTGAFGYVKEFKPVANAFLVLVIVGLVLSNGGFFRKFRDALAGEGATASNAASAAPGDIFSQFDNVFKSVGIKTPKGN